METIFLVEDDQKLNALIKTAVETAGFKCVSVFNGNDATDQFNDDFSLVILDVMLPGKDGWTLLRQFKKSEIPVILLTARASEDDKLFGFELGATDYVTKPFSMKELIARIHVHLKKTAHDIIEMGQLKMDPKKRKVWIQDELITLSVKEFDLLKTFIESDGHVLSRDQLLNHVWQYDYYGDTRTVDTHIKRLRKKISPLNYIHTIHGVGYQFEVNDEPVHI